MKARSREDVLNEVVADSEVGVTVGQLADQLGQHVLEQVLTEGAHSLMRGTFGGYSIEVAVAAIAYALEDQLPAILSEFHQTLGRDSLVKAGGLSKASDFERIPSGPVQDRGFTGGTFDDTVNYYVNFAKELADQYPGAGITVPDDAAERIYKWAKTDAFFISDYMAKQIQRFERNTRQGRELPEWHNFENERESFAIDYLGVFNMLMNGELEGR